MDPLQLLAERSADAAYPVNPYAAELVRGVIANRADIDGVISGNLAGDWTFARLPAVDRAVLRVAAYELRHGSAHLPAAVAVSEAVGLVGDLSTDESPGYVNGVLSAVAALPRPEPPGEADSDGAQTEAVEPGVASDEDEPGGQSTEAEPGADPVPVTPAEIRGLAAHPR